MQTELEFLILFKKFSRYVLHCSKSPVDCLYCAPMTTFLLFLFVISMISDSVLLLFVAKSDLKLNLRKLWIRTRIPHPLPSFLTWFNEVWFSKLKELRNCILRIIRVWSVFCSVQVYISLHFLPILLVKLGFRFSCFCIYGF